MANAPSTTGVMSAYQSVRRTLNERRFHQLRMGGIVRERESDTAHGEQKLHGVAIVDLPAQVRDVDKDGSCELIVGNEKQNAVFAWSPEEKKWNKLPFALPKGAAVGDAQGRDMGLRFVDLNLDGYEDVIWSNEKSFGIYTFFPKKDSLGFDVGWSREIVSGERSGADFQSANGAGILPAGRVPTTSDGTPSEEARAQAIPPSLPNPPSKWLAPSRNSPLHLKSELSNPKFPCPCVRYML